MAEGNFSMVILGRTIEHLGTQMYKHRAPSIAELVANCWDAGATRVDIDIPEPSSYSRDSSSVVVMDDGEGMDNGTIQNQYLVVGRNRRLETGAINGTRRVMGRKGIGKLAGFGLAELICITTWKRDAEQAIRFSMPLAELKQDAGKTEEIQFPWTTVDKDNSWLESGTRIELSQLRHTSPIDIDSLAETLSRRFSRTTRGEMEIRINGTPLAEPRIETIHHFPSEKGYEEYELPDGHTVKYRYQFARKPLKSKELQGFVIYANERTSQAPPFFFNVESTASSQHSTRYITGEICADFLDAGDDNESDLISTDRQELDWEKEELDSLREWGEEFARRLLRECAEKRGKQFENWILNDEAFKRRLDLLDRSVQKEIGRFLKVLGQRSDADDDRTRNLADSLIRAYEFRTFHDVIDDIEEAGEDPEKLEEMLGRLHDWKVLESRAILEIVRGRLSIIERLESLIIANAPETASSKTHENLHDLLADYPWIFNPEWQVFAEETSIGKTLRDWGNRDCPEDMEQKRTDFLAFAKNTDELVIIEMKRPGHAVEFDEVQRLEQYQFELMRSRSICRRVLLYGGNANIPEKKWEDMTAADDFEVVTWSQMFTRAKTFYSHYEAVLKGESTHEGFRRKESEVVRTRQILESDSVYRGKEGRKRGLGDTDP